MCFLSGAAYDESKKGRIFKGALVIGAGMTLTIGGKRTTKQYFWQIGAGVVGYATGSLYKMAVKK